MQLLISHQNTNLATKPFVQRIAFHLRYMYYRNTIRGDMCLCVVFFLVLMLIVAVVVGMYKCIRLVTSNSAQSPVCVAETSSPKAVSATKEASDPTEKSKPRCAGMTKKGTPCKNGPANGFRYCNIHNPCKSD